MAKSALVAGHVFLICRVLISIALLDPPNELHVCNQCWEVKCSLESLMSISLFVNFSSGLRFNSGELRELRTFWKDCCWDAKSKGASTFWI